MKTLNVHEAKTHLSAVLSAVSEKGESFLICRNGHPVADLTPHRVARCVTPHSQMKKIRLKYDPTEALSPDEWPLEMTE